MAVPRATMVEAVLPAAWRRSRARSLSLDVLLVLTGSLVVAVSAQASIRLPFTPVPITGQTFGVLVVGATLGSGRGFLALALYLAEGAAGLPVFAGGTCCVTALAGPTGGYLVSYPAAAWVTGRLAERDWDRRFGTTALAMLAGNAVIYLFGLPWLAAFVTPSQALPMGLFPFVPGDVLKLLLAAGAFPTAWRAVDALRRRAGSG